MTQNKKIRLVNAIHSAAKNTSEDSSSGDIIVESGPAAVATGGILAPNWNIGGFNSRGVFIDTLENSKSQRLSLYHEMSMFPEIGSAIDAICDEAICPGPDGEITEIVYAPFYTPNKSTRKIIDQARREIVTMFKLQEYAWDIFREFLIYGEIAYRINRITSGSDKGITSVEKIHNELMLPVFENGIGPLECIYIMSPGLQTIQEQLSLDEISYTSSDRYKLIQVRTRMRGLTATTYAKVVVSYLERAKRIFYQLKQLEDSLIIYRIARAPERRIFNIDTGMLPPNRAEAYLNDLMRRYRNRLYYNPQTGTVETSPDAMAMTEDFYFAKTSRGGTEVDTLSGGENLGEVEDVMYFLRKLYRALRVPVSRLEPDYQHEVRLAGSIEQQEINFARMVSRESEKFTRLINKVFLDHLVLQEIITQEEADNGAIRLRLKYNNEIHLLKQIEINNARLDTYSSADRIIYTADNEQGPISQEFALKHFMGLTQEELAENNRLLEQEKERVKQAKAEEGNAGSSGRRW